MAALLSGCAPKTSPESEVLLPPVAERRPYVHQGPFGERPDPYHWLRDDSRSDPKVLAHLRAEDAYARQWFAPRQALVETLYQEMIGRLVEDDSSVPVLEHGWWVWLRYTPGQQYPQLLRSREREGQGAELLLDGNVEAEGQAYYQLANYAFSRDGRYLAIAEDLLGRRQHRIRIKDLATGAFLPERIDGSDGSLAFSADGRQLFYIENDPETLLAFRVRRHRLGMPVTDDAVVYEEKDSTFILSLELSKSERYLLIEAESTTTSEVLVLPADDPAATPKPILPRRRDHLYSAEHLGDWFYLLSNDGAKNFALRRVPVATTGAAPETLVPGRDDVLLHAFEPFAAHLAVEVRREGLRRIQVLDLEGRLQREIDGSDASFTMSLDPTPDLASGRLRYVYDSLTTPPETRELDLATGATTLLKAQPVPGYDPSRYQTRHFRVRVRDGAEVPVTLVHHRDHPPGPDAPLFLDAYGSYGYSRDPHFHVGRASLLDRGVLYAIAHVRGGEELGRDWYEQGKLLLKKNTFQDYVDVRDGLVSMGLVSPERVVGYGGSAGGLLMGVVANTAGDRFAGIIAAVPFVDVVTTMLDESLPLTTLEWDEWGDPRQKAYYDYMLSYSPYDNVAAQAYPAMLVSTGLHDSQVQYFEPAKWVARLRERKTDSNPLLFRIDFDAGHGGKSGRYARWREMAEHYVFALDRLQVGP